MNVWLIPTKPEHLDMCWATKLHGTNAPSGKIMEAGDLFFTYVTEKQEVVALCRVVEGPYTPPENISQRLWDLDYDLIWRFEVIESLGPLHISWKGLPGGSACEYGFPSPATGPKKLTSESVASLLGALL